MSDTPQKSTVNAHKIVATNVMINDDLRLGKLLKDIQICKNYKVSIFMIAYDTISFLYQTFYELFCIIILFSSKITNMRTYL